MCLAIPVKVTALPGDQWAEIEVGGIHSRISIALVERQSLQQAAVSRLILRVGQLEQIRITDLPWSEIDDLGQRLVGIDDVAAQSVTAKPVAALANHSLICR